MLAVCIQTFCKQSHCARDEAIYQQQKGFPLARVRPRLFRNAVKKQMSNVKNCDVKHFISYLKTFL